CRAPLRGARGPLTNWTTTTMTAMTSSRWTNPPAVYEVPKPSAHSTKRITATVHSMAPSLFDSHFPDPHCTHTEQGHENDPLPVSAGPFARSSAKSHAMTSRPTSTARMLRPPCIAWPASPCAPHVHNSPIQWPQGLEARASLMGVPTISTSPTAARQRITAHDGSHSNRRMLNFGARGWAWWLLCRLSPPVTQARSREL